MSTGWLGLDVGGANCKLATSEGEAWSFAFPLWKEPDQLSTFLRQSIRGVLDPGTMQGIALTMTGELADCFQTKREGVHHIVSSVQRLSQLPLLVYLTDGRLVTAEVAMSEPLLAAASNWHALAQLIARQSAVHRGLLIDVGSTTTDIIPFADGEVQAQGKTDPERLCAGELVYTGVERTPLGMLLSTARYQGRTCPIAREVFATTLDAYLWSNDIAPRPHDRATADGRPATPEFARDRLARMVGADRECFWAADADWLARAVRQVQVELIVSGIRQVIGGSHIALDQVVWSGQADFLAAEILSASLPGVQVTYLSRMVGDSAARCAPAYAVASLAAAAVSNPSR